MNRNCPAYVIDLAGICLFAGLVGVCGWLMLVAGDRTRQELAELSRSAADAEQDLASLAAVRDQHRLQLTERQEELSTRGHLPDKLPLEDYFQSLAQLAGGNRLHVVRHQPLSIRLYPGLMESRYAYEVSGEFPDVVRFLYAIEQADFWADVSHFRLQGFESQEGAAAPKTAVLTVSVFSAAAEPKETKEGRG